MKIAVLAGELSGDILGAGLIASLRKRYPHACFEGIGGERMIAQGLESLFPLEKLSVMGLSEVLAHLPELIQIHRALRQRFSADPPAVFIGIDAPDFNLPLERFLRVRGVPTVHYVSPQIWAWRRGRVRKIARATRLMLTLLPFEAAFYRDHQVPVRYVGHPLADEIPFQSDRQGARRSLGLAELESPILALLPGSRMGELKVLGLLFLDTAVWLCERCPDLRFVVPAATARIYQYLTELLVSHAPQLPVTVLNGRSQEVMAAANVALVASGTATLETMLWKCPMVVAYKVAPLTGWIVSRLLTVPWVSLPNLLAERQLVPEFIQKAATLENLGPAVLALLNDPLAHARQEAEFAKLHRLLRRDASEQAAAAVAELVGRRDS